MQKLPRPHKPKMYKGLVAADHGALSVKAGPCLLTEDRTLLDGLINDLRWLMQKNRGVGLAAPQLGVSLSVFIMRENPDKETHVLINPVIRDTSGTHKWDEMCMTFPGKFVWITRPERALVQYFDYWGDVQETEFEGLLARCACHEMDHLNGICIPAYGELQDV